jgi:subtilase family serine protease
MLALPLIAIVLPVVAMTSACADPAIVSARASAVNGMTGSLNVYDTAITVRNVGNAAQPSSLLQSVAIYQDGTKVGQLGIQPLKPGASQTVHYRVKRAVGARAGSTQLRFRLILSDPHGVPVTDCSTTNDTYRLTV